MPASRPSVRRSRLRRTAAVLALVVVAATVAAIVVSRNPSNGSGDGGGSTTTTTARQTTTTTTAPPVTPIGTYPVATTSLTVTVSGLAATDDVVPTTVWYPVPKKGSSHRSRAQRRYPVLVFSQGFAEPVSSYATLLTDWASAGFVVAGPTYPHTAPSTPTTLNRADLVHHPADLRAVITSVLEAGRQPGSALSGIINDSEVGLVGQSDGGDVSLAVAVNPCCRYAGVKAVAILSGAEYAPFGGVYFGPNTPAGPPLLVVQGSNDTINPPVCSVQLYEADTSPKYYLDLLDATHLGPYTQATPYAAVVATVTTQFFETELAGQGQALTDMLTSGNVSGVAQLVTVPTAPPAAVGTCPTAPPQS